jgi:hypothetical protein
MMMFNEINYNERYHKIPFHTGQLKWHKNKNKNKNINDNKRINDNKTEPLS